MGVWVWANYGDNVREVESGEIFSERTRRARINPKDADLSDTDIAADIFADEHSLEAGEEIFAIRHENVEKFEVVAKAVRIPASTSRLD